MNTLINYITERIRIDNISKKEFDFDKPIPLPNIMWKFKDDDGHNTQLSNGMWYAGVIRDIRKGNDHNNDMLIFWKEKCPYIPYVTAYTLTKSVNIPWCVVYIDTSEIDVDDNFYDSVSGNIRKIWNYATAIEHPKDKMNAYESAINVVEAWREQLNKY